MQFMNIKVQLDPNDRSGDEEAARDIAKQVAIAIINSGDIDVKDHTEEMAEYIAQTARSIAIYIVSCTRLSMDSANN